MSRVVATIVILLLCLLSFGQGQGHGHGHGILPNSKKAPTITSQPSNSIITEGGNASFSVTATGTRLTYQWKVSTDSGYHYSNLSNAGVYSGTTTATMSITGATGSNNGDKYICVVTGNKSPVATSNAGNLKVWLTLTNNYIARVLADGGSVIDSTFINDLYTLWTKQSMTTLIRYYHSASAGLKKDGSQRVATLYDLSSNNYDLLQTTDSKKFTYSATDANYNNKPSLTVASASSQFMSCANVILPSVMDAGCVGKFSNFFLFEQSVNATTNDGFLFYNGNAGGYGGIRRTNTLLGKNETWAINLSGVFWMRSNAQSQLDVTWNDTYRTITPYIGSLTLTSSTNVTNTLYAMSRAGTSVFSNGTFTDDYFFSGLNTSQYIAMNYFLRNRYFTTTNRKNIYNNNLQDATAYSIGGDYNVHNSFGYFYFTTDADSLHIRYNPTILGTFPYPTNNFNQVIVDINGVQTYNYPTSRADVVIYLGTPGTTRTVKIYEGGNSMPSSTLIGTYIQAITIQSKYTYTLLNATPVIKYVFLGNSITNGGTPTNPASEAYTMLFRYTDGKTVSVMGHGYASINSVASSAALCDTTAQRLKRLCNGSTNYVIIALGTNDYGLNKEDTTNFKIYFNQLLDSCVSKGCANHYYILAPIARSSETANSLGYTLDHYRTAIRSVVGTRANFTYINCKTFVSAGNLVDGVHPNTAGHLEFYNALKLLLP